MVGWPARVPDLYQGCNTPHFLQHISILLVLSQSQPKVRPSGVFSYPEAKEARRGCKLDLLKFPTVTFE